VEISQSNLNDFVEVYMNNVADSSMLANGDIAPVAIDILDTEGNIYYANQRCVELYDLDAQKINEYKLTDLAVHDKHVKELEQHVRWLVAERPYPTPYIGLNKTLSGEVIHVRVHWDYIIHKDKVIGFFSMITNLSERVPSLERYRANEAIVHAMIQTMLCGVMILGTSGEILEINSLCAQILGCSKNEILGYTLTDLLIPVKSAENMTWSELSSAPSALVNEYRLKKNIKNHRRYVLIESASALVYKSVSSLIVFVKDVTHDRQEAHALAIKKRELEQHYRQTLLTEMVSGMAHEMNQPLSAITNYTKGCMRRLEEQNVDPEILQTLEMVVRQANRASNIIQHMRAWDVEKSESYYVVNVKNLVNGSVRLLEFDLHEAKIHLNQKIVLDYPEVYGCQIQLEQVLINLLRNAIDAIKQKTKQGAGATKKIAIEMQRGPANTVDLIVRDSGAGVSKKDAEHLFEPFFTTKDDGMGIGLALSEKIIQDHGGRLSYSACSGDYNTAFILNLPIYIKPGKDEEDKKHKGMMDYGSKAWVSL
jgi:two-component system sensor kinase FixL